MNEMNKKVNEVPRTNSPYPESKCSNTYEKHYRDKDAVIVTYDSKGRMREVKSVYGDFHHTVGVK